MIKNLYTPASGQFAGTDPVELRYLPPGGGPLSLRRKEIPKIALIYTPCVKVFSYFGANNVNTEMSSRGDKRCYGVICCYFFILCWQINGLVIIYVSFVS